MMSNSIIMQIRCHVPQDEVALLCCSLPSLIEQIMWKSPWLTPNDVIQWLTADILVKLFSKETTDLSRSEDS